MSEYPYDRSPPLFFPVWVGFGCLFSPFQRPRAEVVLSFRKDEQIDPSFPAPLHSHSGLFPPLSPFEVIRSEALAFLPDETFRRPMFQSGDVRLTPFSPHPFSCRVNH